MVRRGRIEASAGEGGGVAIVLARPAVFVRAMRGKRGTAASRCLTDDARSV